MSVVIAPSILAADLCDLAGEVRSVLDAGGEWIHVDVMDGQFAPNLTMGVATVAALRKRFDCPLDVHLMIERPERFIDAFAAAGASTISVHAESTPHVQRALQLVRDAGAHAALAINPGTGLDLLDSLCDDVDMVLLMTVNPGFGGQAFLPAMVRKIRETRRRLDQFERPEVQIEVDGGITPATIGCAVTAGASICVAGSFVFSSPDRTQAIAQLKGAAAPDNPVA